MATLVILGVQLQPDVRQATVIIHLHQLVLMGFQKRTDLWAALGLLVINVTKAQALALLQVVILIVRQIIVFKLVKVVYYQVLMMIKYMMVIWKKYND